ncbi:hypothetical protein FS749_007251, partial [Ceratobasidium sp. UAMH 11750]
VSCATLISEGAVSAYHSSNKLRLCCIADCTAVHNDGNGSLAGGMGGGGESGNPPKTMSRLSIASRSDKEG